MKFVNFFANKFPPKKLTKLAMFVRLSQPQVANIVRIQNWFVGNPIAFPIESIIVPILLVVDS